MINKIMQEIRKYGSFMSEIDFAITEIRKIIEWLYISKDLGIIDREDFEDCYHYAIDAVVDLEEYKNSL